MLPRLIARICPSATPGMPSRGSGPQPRPSAPPSRICSAAATISAIEGTRMLPVPRRIDASVLNSHTVMAPPEQHAWNSPAPAQHLALPAEQHEQPRPDRQEEQRIQGAAERADDQRMQRHRLHPRRVAGAKGARQRRRHTAAHGTRREHAGEHRERKHQPHRRQRRNAERADVEGFGQAHQHRHRSGHDIGCGQAQQRAQDRPRQQRVRRGDCGGRARRHQVPAVRLQGGVGRIGSAQARGPERRAGQRQKCAGTQRLRRTDRTAPVGRRQGCPAASRPGTSRYRWP